MRLVSLLNKVFPPYLLGSGLQPYTNLAQGVLCSTEGALKNFKVRSVSIGRVVLHTGSDEVLDQNFRLGRQWPY